MDHKSPQSLAPARAVVGETKTVTILDYASGLQALVSANHYNQSDNYFAVFRFIGTDA